MPRRVIAKKIGELLIERKIISPEELTLALDEQRKKGGYISQHLIALGFATEFDIANCLANQYGFAYLPLSNYTVPLELREVIPLKLIKLFSILPVDKVGEVLTVAMADPLNDGVIEMLQQITKCDIQIFISTYSELKRAINKYFGDKIEEMERQAVKEIDPLREKLLEHFVQTAPYKGLERRRYKRLYVDLDAQLFLTGGILEAKIKNISYVGVFFICDRPVAIETNIVFKMKAGDLSIEAIVQVLRMEKINLVQEIDSYTVTSSIYGIAGFFNFISDEDKKKLALFLNEIQDQQRQIRGKTPQ